MRTKLLKILPLFCSSEREEVLSLRNGCPPARAALPQPKSECPGALSRTQPGPTLKAHKVQAGRERIAHPAIQAEIFSFILSQDRRNWSGATLKIYLSCSSCAAQPDWHAGLMQGLLGNKQSQVVDFILTQRMP